MDGLGVRVLGCLCAVMHMYLSTDIEMLSKRNAST